MAQSFLLPHRHLVLNPTNLRRIPTPGLKTTVALASSRGSKKPGPFFASSASSSQSVVLEQSTSVAHPMTQMAKNMGFRPSPELGLLLVSFVITSVFGAFLSLAALRKLAVAMQKLSKVVAEEVPGTLSSLKLSSLEINDLTQQLSSLRQRISGKKNGMTEDRKTKRKSNGGGRNPIIN
ncbi:uncharacterized protein [Aristolochia californica]|uniref:uncharacterized protein isoform X2 n=1 Tax=Aristolochia californica TaxID=171875 RepID=UPI0035DD0BE8